MNTSMLRMLASFLLGSLMLPPLHAESNILLYPLARLFGSPPEAELTRCRQAFAQLQAHLDTSRVLVQPVLFVDAHQRTWRRKLAGELAREAAAHTTAKLTVANAGAPDVAPAELGHNQLAYLWARSADYAGWVRQAHLAEDYAWFLEIWGHDGRVGAIQVYVFDATGQLAYCRLFNSHQFGPDLSLGGPEVIRLVVRRFFEDLSKDPLTIFPRYGVG